MGKSFDTCTLFGSTFCTYIQGGVCPCNCYHRREENHVKRLLDEFAMAYKTQQDENDPYFNRFDRADIFDRIACASYEYAAAMMRERARRDENGNIKEV